MKCSHCGGNLTLKDEYCPHCGQLNEQSAQHVRDMKQYRGRFDATHRSVWERLWKYQSVSVRVVVLAVLVILIIAVHFADENLYSIERSIADSRASRNAESNIEQINAYLEEENYYDLYYFLYANRIGNYSYPDDPYEAYYPLRMASLYYVDVYRDLMTFAAEGDEDDYSVSSLEASLEGFYRETDESSVTGYGYEDLDMEPTLEAFTGMRSNINALLITYCGLTEEETERFPEMSSAQRMVLLTERVSE